MADQTSAGSGFGETRLHSNPSSYTRRCPNQPMCDFMDRLELFSTCPVRLGRRL